MKHLNIASTLGWANVEDFTEGLHLQAEEAAKIDQVLGKNANAVAELETANSTIQELTEKEKSLSEQAKKDGETIAALKAEVEELGKGSSGSGSKIKSESDEEETTASNEKLPRYDDPNHPANLSAKKFGISKKK